MANIGSIRKGFGTHYVLELDWVVNSQDATNNTSNVTFTAKLISLGGCIHSIDEKHILIEIDDQVYFDKCIVGISNGENKILMVKNVNIAHDLDGTKLCSVTCSIGMGIYINGIYVGCLSVSGRVKLDAIVRKSICSFYAIEKVFYWISAGVVVIDQKNRIGHCYLILERTNESDCNQLKINRNKEYKWMRGENMYVCTYYSYDTDSERLRLSMNAWIVEICKQYKVELKFERE